MPHSFEMPQNHIDRVIERQGREHTCESFHTRKTALVVVDMQNYFMDESQQAGCPIAQTVVDNVNKLGDTVRRNGG
ncbi:MAG: cysteine hydrolase, partial [Pseudomonadota bacterium]|nr:cysteine hydrolase [Pseudomonadota bacterium]